MTNIVQFRAPQWNAQSRAGGLIRAFAGERRQADDVFWLKENAELLGVLVATKSAVSLSDLEPMVPFYERLEQRAYFFPQYYRFFLSLALDLEDLGLHGDTGARLCEWAAHAGLDRAELSDLQRAEAGRLYARRGVAQIDPGLNDRLHQFINRSETFSMPNRKAAYELTHIVFYLSEYGQRDPMLEDEAITSLEFAGLLAYLDQNIDLLAEICVALHFAGREPSAIWQSAVQHALCGAVLGSGVGQDDYHEYLVTAWADRLAGGDGFRLSVPEGQLLIAMPKPTHAALRPMSEAIFAMEGGRESDWERMKRRITPQLGPDSRDILDGAERSTDKFDAFFAGFARAAR